MSTARPSHLEPCPKCDDRVISSAITFPRSEERAMPLSSPLARPVRALAAFAALLVLAGCKADTAPAPKSERPVQIQRVSFQDVDRTREFVGVVRPRYETDVGDRVAVGDVVARLDPEDLRLQLQSDDAELAAASSNLAQAAADFERYAKLKTNGWASVADFDRKKAASDEAQGRLDRARRALDLARNQLTYADLKADADGVITATLAEAGQVVAIGQPVARLAHHSEKEAVVALPETWLNEARKSKAIVRLWADRERSFEARLRELSPQADAATRTYAARFTIENADEAVAYGMTATVTLTPAVDAKVAKLPLSAILNRGTGPSVYVVDTSGTLILRPVTVASFAEDAALVTRGIAEGDKVVTLGVHKLEAGLNVRTVR